MVTKRTLKKSITVNKIDAKIPLKVAQALKNPQINRF